MTSEIILTSHSNKEFLFVLESRVRREYIFWFEKWFLDGFSYGLLSFIIRVSNTDAIKLPFFTLYFFLGVFCPGMLTD